MNSIRYCFVYGSWLNTDHLSKSLGHAILDDTVVLARVEGFQRVWNVRRQVDGDGGPRTALMLNLVATPSAWVNGALIEVSSKDLEILDELAPLYHRIEIDPKAIMPALDLSTPCYAYQGDASLSSASVNAFISSHDHSTLMDALTQFGATFEREFHESTKAHGVAIADFGSTDEVRNNLGHSQ